MSNGESWAHFTLPRATALGRFESLLTSVGTLRARRIGSPAAEELRPRVESEAPPRSLSRQFGLGTFPPHVDGAHHRIPPRLLVMWCAEDQQRRPTLLHSWEPVAARIPKPDRLHREVYHVRTGRHSFADSMTAPGRPFVRFDPGCMIPGTREAACLMDDVIAELNVDRQSVEWSAGTGVVVDNWRVLHSRGRPDAEGSRRLFRAWLDLPGE